MLYRIYTPNDITPLRERLPVHLCEKLIDECLRIEQLYGADRNLFQTGGMAVLAETSKDIAEFRSTLVDYTFHPCEWASPVTSTNYLSALFIRNNDYTITLYAPKELLEDLL